MDRRKPAAVAAAAVVVALVGLATLGRQARQRTIPFQGCEALLQHFPLDRAGDHVRKLPDGLFEYLLDDCQTVTSHGGDPGEVEGPGLSTTTSSTLQSLGAPVCATDYKFVVVYLKPSNVTSRYSTMKPTLQNIVKQVDGKLVAEARNRMGSSAASHYKVACDANGIRVDNRTSSQSTSSATFSNLISDLQSMGYTSNTEKVVAFWDGAISSTFSGQATVRNDSSDAAGNTNNNGQSYAFAYGSTSWSTWMHEMGHNLGSVQQDAPGAAPPGWHCDGGKDSDIMCYNDGSSGWASAPVCGTNPVSGQNSYDHCHNQYWAPENRTGTSYAATRWNQAECYDRWLVSTWCGTVPGPTPSPTPTTSPTTTSSQSSSSAVYDSALGAPKCATVQSLCDTGPTLVRGKDTLSGGAELNQPNTVDSCTDGTTTDAGYTVDESIESVQVKTSDGTAFAPGKSVLVTVKAYIYDSAADRLDVLFAGSAGGAWTLATTLTPAATGLQTLTATYTLPVGSVQAVRADLRWGGTAGPCSVSNYDDVDDLAFAVGTGPTPTPTPTATVTATPTPTPTATGTAQCSDGIDNDGDGRIDAADNGCLEDPEGNGSYVYTASNNSESTHVGQWATNTAPSGFPICDSTGPFQVSEHGADDPTICHVDRDGTI